MGRFYDAPCRPEARATPSARRRLSNDEVKRAVMANKRLLVARAAANALPHKEGELPRERDMVAAVRAIQAELGDWVPTRPTIHSLALRYLSAPDELREDTNYYMVVGAGGRSRTTLVPSLEKSLRADIDETPSLTTGQLIIRINEYAKRYRVELPGEYALRRIIEEMRGGVLGRSNALHGRRAGEVDGLPHESRDAKHPHHIWTMDELVLGLWVGMFSEELDRFVSTMIYIIFVLDYLSRCLLSYHVCDPSRRRDSKGRQVFTGFDQHDVMTAFLKAARADLAPPHLQPVAGFLPNVILMDGHPTHHAWKTAVSPFIPTKISLVADYRPYRNGVQERMGCSAKDAFAALFAGVPGDVNAYIPTDRLRQNQHEARVQSAATTERVRRKTEVIPEDLPRVSEVDDLILPRISDFYNRERPHSAHGKAAPYHVHMALRPRRHSLIDGGALVRALETKTLTVSRGALQLQQDDRVRHFQAQIGGRILPVGSSIVAHVHPLLKCLWAVEGRDHQLVKIPLLSDAAANQSPAYVARARADMTGGMSERAQAALDKAHERRVGAEGAEATRQAAEDALASDPKPRKSPTPGGAPNAGDLADLAARASTAPALSTDTWLGQEGEAPPSPGDATSPSASESTTTESVATPGSEASASPDKARKPRKPRSAETRPRQIPKPSAPVPAAAPSPPHARVLNASAFWLETAPLTLLTPADNGRPTGSPGSEPEATLSVPPPATAAADIADAS